MAAIIAELERDPKQFSGKKGEPAGTRAARMRHQGEPWRVVFRIFEKDGVVLILAIGKRDGVYRIAARRI